MLSLIHPLAAALTEFYSIHLIPVFFAFNSSGYSWGPAILAVGAVTVLPRLVTTIRELYARDLRGRCGSSTSSLFGLSLLSQPDRAGGVSAIVFASARQNDWLEEGVDTVETVVEEEGDQSSGGGEA